MTPAANRTSISWTSGTVCAMRACSAPLLARSSLPTSVRLSSPSSVVLLFWMRSSRAKTPSCARRRIKVPAGWQRELDLALAFRQLDEDDARAELDDFHGSTL